MRAYEVTLWGVECVVMAKSAAQAKARVILDAADAGFGGWREAIRRGGLTCRRCPRFDGSNGPGYILHREVAS